MREKIGILGGTFDPIHNMHLFIADEARRKLSLDKVIFVPAIRPYHKDGRKISDYSYRYNMVKIAIKDYEYFDVSDIEKNAGLDKSYTYLMLEKLSVLYEDADLYLIMGSDSLLDIGNWKNANKIFEYSNIVVFQREYNDKRDLMLKIQIGDLEDKYGKDIVLIKSTVNDLSSSKIRGYVIDREYKNLDMPLDVIEYIKTNKIYDEK